MRPPSQVERVGVATAVLVVGPLVLLGAPLLVGAALVADAASGGRRLRHSRLILFGLNALLVEMAGIVAAAVLWLGAGFGRRLSEPGVVAVHDRVQRAWGCAMFDAARRWLGLEIAVDGLDALGRHEPGTSGAGGDGGSTGGGSDRGGSTGGDGGSTSGDAGPAGKAAAPVTIVAQHASFFDALLPTVLLAATRQARPRHVLKAELAWAPCLGIFGHRLPNYFVARRSRAGGPAGGRSDRDAQLTTIERLAADAGAAPVVIFPEGTFYTTERAGRARARMHADDPRRAARLDLNHVLPVRPGGVLALMRGRQSDLVFIGHDGFARYGTIRSIVANVPFTRPVAVKIWRVPACVIPTDTEARLALVDLMWQQLDDWIAAQRHEIPA